MEAKWYHFGSILHGFWVRVGRILDASSKARCHKIDCRVVLRPQDHSCTDFHVLWGLSGTILDRFWKDFECELGGIWLLVAASRSQFAVVKATSGDIRRLTRRIV